MEKEKIKLRIKQLIESDLKIKIKSDDQDLLQSKLIDSYTMLLIITFIREELGIEVQMDKLDFNTFSSINSIADFVLK